MKPSSRGGTAFALTTAAAASFFALAMMAPPIAEAAADAPVDEPVISTRKIFMLLFLMLGPVKILVPFVNLTKGADAAFRRRMA
ncbi:MAG: MarC family protein, partial [Bradyrhizobium sp.]